MAPTSTTACVSVMLNNADKQIIRRWGNVNRQQQVNMGLRFLIHLDCLVVQAPHASPSAASQSSSAELPGSPAVRVIIFQGKRLAFVSLPFATLLLEMLVQLHCDVELFSLWNPALAALVVRSFQFDQIISGSLSSSGSGKGVTIRTVFPPSSTRSRLTFLEAFHLMPYEVHRTVLVDHAAAASAVWHSLLQDHIVGVRLTLPNGGSAGSWSTVGSAVAETKQRHLAFRGEYLAGGGSLDTHDEELAAQQPHSVDFFRAATQQVAPLLSVLQRAMRLVELSMTANYSIHVPILVQHLRSSIFFQKRFVVEGLAVSHNETRHEPSSSIAGEPSAASITGPGVALHEDVQKACMLVEYHGGVIVPPSASSSEEDAEADFVIVSTTTDDHSIDNGVSSCANVSAPTVDLDWVETCAEAWSCAFPVNRPSLHVAHLDGNADDIAEALVVQLLVLFAPPATRAKGDGDSAASAPQRWFPMSTFRKILERLNISYAPMEHDAFLESLHQSSFVLRMTTTGAGQHVDASNGRATLHQDEERGRHVASSVDAVALRPWAPRHVAIANIDDHISARTSARSTTAADELREEVRCLLTRPRMIDKATMCVATVTASFSTQTVAIAAAPPVTPQQQQQQQPATTITVKTEPITEDARPAVPLRQTLTAPSSNASSHDSEAAARHASSMATFHAPQMQPNDNIRHVHAALRHVEASEPHPHHRQQQQQLYLANSSAPHILQPPPMPASSPQWTGIGPVMEHYADRGNEYAPRGMEHYADRGGEYAPRVYRGVPPPSPDTPSYGPPPAESSRAGAAGRGMYFHPHEGGRGPVVIDPSREAPAGYPPHHPQFHGPTSYPPHRPSPYYHDPYEPYEPPTAYPATATAGPPPADLLADIVRSLTDYDHAHHRVVQPPPQPAPPAAPPTVDPRLEGMLPSYQFVIRGAPIHRSRIVTIPLWAYGFNIRGSNFSQKTLKQTITSSFSMWDTDATVSVADGGKLLVLRFCEPSAAEVFRASDVRFNSKLKPKLLVLGEGENLEGVPLSEGRGNAQLSSDDSGGFRSTSQQGNFNGKPTNAPPPSKRNRSRSRSDSEPRRRRSKSKRRSSR